MKLQRPIKEDDADDRQEAIVTTGRALPALVMPGLHAHEVELATRISTAELMLAQANEQIAALRQQRLILTATTVVVPTVVWLCMRSRARKLRAANATPTGQISA